MVEGRGGAGAEGREVRGARRGRGGCVDDPRGPIRAGRGRGWMKGWGPISRDPRAGQLRAGAIRDTGQVRGGAPPGQPGEGDRRFIYLGMATVTCAISGHVP